MAPTPGAGDQRQILPVVAELVHRGSAFSPSPLIFGVVPSGPRFRIEAWEVATAPDPLDPLIGWLAPDEWAVVGLTFACRLPGGSRCVDADGHDLLGDRHDRDLDLDDDLDHELDVDPDDELLIDDLDDDRDHEVAGGLGLALGDRATLAVDRAGEARLVLGGPTDGLLHIDASGMPVGDALSRLLGVATPPPELTPGAWVELRWLDRIAELVLERPGRVTWAQVARCHPLHDDRKAAEPLTLALATLAHDATTTWASLRSGWSDPPTDGHPPGIGRSTSLTEWFDDGSYARWVQRDLPPSDLLVDAVLANLPDAVAADLVQALVTT